MAIIFQSRTIFFAILLTLMGVVVSPAFSQGIGIGCPCILPTGCAIDPSARACLSSDTGTTHTILNTHRFNGEVDPVNDETASDFLWMPEGIDFTRMPEGDTVEE